jgi:hypothetical protein
MSFRVWELINRVRIIHLTAEQWLVWAAILLIWDLRIERLFFLLSFLFIESSVSVRVNIGIINISIT